MISVEKIGEKILIRFPYNKDYIEKIKSIDSFTVVQGFIRITHKWALVEY